MLSSIRPPFPKDILDFFSDLSSSDASREAFLKAWKKGQPEAKVLLEKSFAWILSKSGLPWLELDLQPPYEAMFKEAKSVQDRLLSHRSGNNSDPYMSNRGWKALPLHGISASHTLSFNVYGYKREEDAPYTWTDISELCPETTRFFKEVYPCDQYFRVRYVVLEPGGYILPHIDRTEPFLWEVNLALNHPEGCVFRMEPNLYVPFREKSTFILDVSRKHAVINTSNEPRFHMIVHGNPIRHPGWADLIVRSFHKSLKNLG